MDQRFHLSVTFSIYGQTYEWKDVSLNWCDTGDGIDREIFEFFRKAHARAYRNHEAALIKGQAKQAEKQLRDKEIAERDRLIAKYGATP